MERFWEERTTEELLAELADLQKDGFASALEVIGLKEQIIQRNTGLVHAIAGEFLSAGEPFEELLQAGYLGLLNAVHHFDYKRGLKFSTYATHLIKGEIRHHIRNRYLIRIPGWLVMLADRLKTAEEQFFRANGRLPTLKELSQILHMTEHGIVEVLKARECMNYVSFDEGLQADDLQPTIDLESIPSEEPSLPPMELRIQIQMAVEKLPEIQRRVIRSLFYDGETQEQVARKLGYSQRHISRLKEEGLEEIKRELIR